MHSGKSAVISKSGIENFTEQLRKRNMDGSVAPDAFLYTGSRGHCCPKCAHVRVTDGLIDSCHHRLEGGGRHDTKALNGDVPNCHRVPSTGVRSPHLSPGEDSRDHLIGRVEPEKVARVLYDAELRARDRSGIGGPLIVAGPVVAPVEQERRPVNALVLPASGFPTFSVAYQRHERPIVVPSVADQIHLSGQRLRQGPLAVDPPSKTRVAIGYRRSRFTVAPSTGTLFRPKSRFASAELFRMPRPPS